LLFLLQYYFFIIIYKNIDKNNILLLTIILMGTKRKRYGRKKSKVLGSYLKKWRKDADLTLSEAAVKLGFAMKNAGAYLSMIENGKRPVPDAALQQVHKVYKVPVEEVMKRTYYQLSFHMFDVFSATNTVQTEVNKYIKTLEAKLDEDEKKELLNFISFLLVRKTVSNK
jgi:transcriptional regulator with XRE-family HTH domain